MDNEHMPFEDNERELEAQALAVVKKFIPVVSVAKNATKVLRRLTSVGTNTLVAALEAGTSWFHLKKAHNEHLIAQLAELPAGQSAIVVKVTGRLIEEQRRINQLVFEAIEHVQISDQTAPSEEGRREIDDDWIESFRGEAVDRSQGEMRETFARILAGEIREPGTFSIKTLRTVGALSQSTANLFRKTASLRVGMEIVRSNVIGSAPRVLVLDARLPALGGQLGDNYLKSEGLAYERLIELTEHGLLHSDYDSWKEYGAAMVSPHSPLFFHQGRRWALIPLTNFKAGSNLIIHGAKFTTVGQELLHIVDIESDAGFLDKVRTYLKGKHVKMVAHSSSMT